MPILATKNGLERTFSDSKWNDMPRDKYGWTQTSAIASTSIPIPAELVKKKMEQGVIAKDAEPIEIVKTQNIPNELVPKPKGRPKNDLHSSK